MHRALDSIPNTCKRERERERERERDRETERGEKKESTKRMKTGQDIVAPHSHINVLAFLFSLHGLTCYQFQVLLLSLA
jgi:hypothetical protein